jgi:hypothetical protein
MTFMGKEVYGMSHWKGDFNQDFKPGDYVNSEIVWEMANCVPPRSFSNSLVQCGEPYSHREDKNGKFRPTFTTFENIRGGLDEDSVWKYCGHCFGGETENQD